MRYVTRLVFYYYDEFDTTLAYIFDVVANANNKEDAVEIAKEKAAEKIKIFSNPGYTDLISVTDENDSIYVLSGNQFSLLPERDHSKLRTSFCSDGETHMTITA